MFQCQNKSKTYKGTSFDPLLYLNTLKTDTSILQASICYHSRADGLQSNKDKSVSRQPGAVHYMKSFLFQSFRVPVNYHGQNFFHRSYPIIQDSADFKSEIF